MTAKIIRLPSGRDVVDTGRVQIGSTYMRPAPRECGVEAERIQTALLHKQRRIGDAPVMWACAVGAVVLVVMVALGWLR